MFEILGRRSNYESAMKMKTSQKAKIDTYPESLRVVNLLVQTYDRSDVVLSKIRKVYFRGMKRITYKKYILYAVETSKQAKNHKIYRKQ